MLESDSELVILNSIVRHFLSPYSTDMHYDVKEELLELDFESSVFVQLCSCL